VTRPLLSLLGLLCLGAAPSDAPRRVPGEALVPARASVMPAPVPAAPTGKTRCNACHSVGGWGQVTFPHEKTGFPLNGAHATVTCQACHPVDFVKTVPQTCSGCHRDAHSGTLGSRCESCHEETSWRSTFTVDAHRNTNFPLTGRHGLLPCESCHPDARGRTFSRQTLDCVGCHQADYARAASLGIDHVALGFSTDCKSCHDFRLFTNARFPGHDSCFQISIGAHAGIACENCHSRIFPTGGVCNTGTETCISCHSHTKAITDPQHANLDPKTKALYQASGYQNVSCYGCHMIQG
jgi:hypothetical protein